MISMIEFVKEYGGSKEFRLANGLRILLIPYGVGEAVGFMVHYNVGSRNEAVGYTGSTHFLEHLLFKGSVKFPADTHPIMKFFGSIGAVFNANTWVDRTGYYEIVVPEHLEKCMALEADRMRGATFTDKDRQDEMPVVRNELEMGESSDVAALSELVDSTAIQQHPYHHPTIGWRSDVEGVSTDRIRQFYDEFYYPNNALVIFVGSLPDKTILEMVEKHFGAIEPSPNPIPEVYTQEPKQAGERRVTLTRSGSNGIVDFAWVVPGFSHKDRAPLEVLKSILISGQESLLIKNFVDTGIVHSIRMELGPFKDPYLFHMFVTLLGTKGHSRVESKIRKFLESLQKDGFNSADVERAHRLVQAYKAYEQDGIVGILNSTSFAEGAGSWELRQRYVENIHKVTLDDVMRVFRQYFVRDNSTIGWFVPKKIKGDLQ